MKKLIERFKLIEYLKIDLNLSKEEFISKLKENVEEEYFVIGEKKKFKGEINEKHFKFKKKRYPLQFKNFSLVKGKYKVERNRIVVNLEISIISLKAKFFFVIILLFFLYVIIVSALFLKVPYELIPLILVLLIPFCVMKKNILIIKEDVINMFHLFDSV